MLCVQYYMLLCLWRCRKYLSLQYSEQLCQTKEVCSKIAKDNPISVDLLWSKPQLHCCWCPVLVLFFTSHFHSVKTNTVCEYYFSHKYDFTVSPKVFFATVLLRSKLEMSWSRSLPYVMAVFVCDTMILGQQQRQRDREMYQNFAACQRVERSIFK